MEVGKLRTLIYSAISAKTKIRPLKVAFIANNAAKSVDWYETLRIELHYCKDTNGIEKAQVLLEIQGKMQKERPRYFVCIKKFVNTKNETICKKGDVLEMYFDEKEKCDILVLLKDTDIRFYFPNEKHFKEILPEFLNTGRDLALFSSKERLIIAFADQINMKHPKVKRIKLNQIHGWKAK